MQIFGKNHVDFFLSELLFTIKMLAYITLYVPCFVRNNYKKAEIVQNTPQFLGIFYTRRLFRTGRLFGTLE